MVLKIEKCYICTGANGYAPTYNPIGKEFGCLAKTNKLQHSLKIIVCIDNKLLNYFITKPFDAIKFFTTMCIINSFYFAFRIGKTLLQL